MTGETLVVRGRPAVGSVRAGRLCGPDDSSFDFSVMCRGWMGKRARFVAFLCSRRTSLLWNSSDIVAVKYGGEEHIDGAIVLSDAIPFIDRASMPFG